MSSILEWLFGWIIEPIVDSFSDAVLSVVDLMPSVSEAWGASLGLVPGWAHQWLPIEEVTVAFGGALAAYFGAITVRLLRMVISLFTGGGGS